MEKIEYVVGNPNIMEIISEVHAWKPFDERVIEFCGVLSTELTKDRRIQSFPDLVALAFWLRKNNIVRISKDYADMDHHLGKGLVFHIAPGNVALSFAYSLMTGLLTGNTNIVRMPSRVFEQANLFCEKLRAVLIDNTEIVDRICLIKYPHDKSITDELSAKCHMRIIWGGDQTITTIRQSMLSPRATELTFADRFSICIIDADNYLSNYEPAKTAHDFYIDTYLTDQNACSSPRIIFWMGKSINRAQKIFWDALDKEIVNYDMAPVTTVNKLLTFCKYAADNKARLIVEKDYRIMRIKIDAINSAILNNIGNSGFFYECNIDNIKDILPICTWKLQTLSYIGVDNVLIKNFAMNYAPKGIDKILPVGKTMDYSFIIDGCDVIRAMSRELFLNS